MKVGYSSLRYFSASIVSFELMMTSPFSSSSDAPCDHRIQLAKPLPSPTALPSAKPAGLPAAFSFLHSSSTPPMSSGTLS